jgi:hypothetical protein
MKIDEKIGKFLKDKISFKKTREQLKADKEERKRIDLEIEHTLLKLTKLKNIRKKLEKK